MRLLIGIVVLLLFTACATEYQTPEQEAEHARRMNEAGDALIEMSSGMQNRRPSNGCSTLSIAPIARAGCSYVCIDGRWAEVCR
jgi:hypothetical protein